MADADGLLRDLRSLSHPNSLRSNRDAPGARYGLSASRPSTEAVRRKASLSSYISRDIIIHCSLLIINYHEEVCLEYHSQSDHRCCYRHRRGLRPASLPIVLASLPHPFPLPKEDNLPKRGHPLPRRTVFLKGPASPQRAGNGSPSGLSGRA